MQQKVLNLNNKNLSYRIYGNGPVVVLVHGFGEDGNVWQKQVEHLQKAFKIVVPDLPGSGASEMTEDMSMEGLAESVFKILEAEGIDQGVMIGHSMGGYVTLAFAEKYSNKLEGFGLFHSTAYADTPEKIATREKGIKFIEEHGAFEFLKTTIPNLYSPATKEANQALIDKQINSVQGFTNAALTAYYRSMINRPDRTAILKGTTLPVLFVLGRHDNAIPIKDGLEQSHLPQISYVHILEQSGHMGMMEEEEKSNGLLTEYLTATLQHTIH